MMSDRFICWAVRSVVKSYPIKYTEHNFCKLEVLDFPAQKFMENIIQVMARDILCYAATNIYD